VRTVIFLVFFLLIGCGKGINGFEKIKEPIIVDMDTMRWEQSDFPIKMKVSENLEFPSQQLANDAMDEWERGANTNFFEPIERTPLLNFTKLSDFYYKDKAVQGIYLATNMIDELDENNLAVAQVMFFKDTESSTIPFYHIIHADIVLNGYNFIFSSDFSDDSSYYFLTLILHELGHVLGLGHEAKGIMYPFMSTFDKQGTLISFDRELINDKYNLNNIPARKIDLGVKEIQRTILFLPAKKFLTDRRLNFVRKR